MVGLSILNINFLKSNTQLDVSRKANFEKFDKIVSDICRNNFVETIDFDTRVKLPSNIIVFQDFQEFHRREVLMMFKARYETKQPSIYSAEF